LCRRTSDLGRSCFIAATPQDKQPRTAVLHRNYAAGRAISCKLRTGLARLPNFISGRPFSGPTQFRGDGHGSAVQCSERDDTVWYSAVQ
jgi:hypothetical protein